MKFTLAASMLILTLRPALIAATQPDPTAPATSATPVKEAPAAPGALDAARLERAEAIARKAAAFLRSQQDAASGGWSVPERDADNKPKSPHLPGLSALVLNALLSDPTPAKPAADDPVITRGVDYLLTYRQPDGGIYDRILPSYNTALALSALSKLNTPRARAAIKPAQDFLRHLQWSEDSDPTIGGAEAPKPVTREHIFYGGVGYGRNGRPDNSNLNVVMQALQDSGVSPEDPAVQRALVFLSRTQMLDSVSDMPYADGSRQGGFVYSTAENAESVDGRAGQSMAGTIEETLSDGTKASRLRAYGSMTYAGFKTYIYANLPRDDPRVEAAYGWIRRNYTVDENPGMGTDGYYYYLLTFARALDAWGGGTIAPLPADAGPSDAAGSKPDAAPEATSVATPAPNSPAPRNWRADLIDKLASLQLDDGSFKSIDDRWMENNPVLITAYSLTALRAAMSE